MILLVSASQVPGTQLVIFLIYIRGNRCRVSVKCFTATFQPCTKFLVSPAICLLPWVTSEVGKCKRRLILKETNKIFIKKM
jgi:hypothetical protein